MNRLNKLLAPLVATLAIGSASGCKKPQELKIDHQRAALSEAMQNALPKGRENAVDMAQAAVVANLANYITNVLAGYQVMLQANVEAHQLPETGTDAPITEKLTFVAAYTNETAAKEIQFYQMFRDVITMQIEAYEALNQYFADEEAELTTAAMLNLSSNAAGTGGKKAEAQARQSNSTKVEETRDQLSTLRAKLAKVEQEISRLEAEAGGSGEAQPTPKEEADEIMNLGHLTGNPGHTIVQQLEELSGRFTERDDRIKKKLKKEFPLVDKTAKTPVIDVDRLDPEGRERFDRLTERQIALMEGQQAIAAAQQCLAMAGEINVGTTTTDGPSSLVPSTTPTTDKVVPTGTEDDADAEVNDPIEGETTVDFTNPVQVTAKKIAQLKDEYANKCGAFSNIGSGKIENPFKLPEGLSAPTDFQVHQEIFMAITYTAFAQLLEQWAAKYENKKAGPSKYEFASMWQQALAVAQQTKQADSVNLASAPSTSFTLDQRVDHWEKDQEEDPQADGETMTTFFAEQAQYGLYPKTGLPNKAGTVCAIEAFKFDRPESITLAGTALCADTLALLESPDGSKFHCSRCDRTGVEIDDATGKHITASTMVARKEWTSGQSTQGMRVMHPGLNLDPGQFTGQDALNTLVHAGTLDALPELVIKTMSTPQE